MTWLNLVKPGFLLFSGGIEKEFCLLRLYDNGQMGRCDGPSQSNIKLVYEVFFENVSVFGVAD